MKEEEAKKQENKMTEEKLKSKILEIPTINNLIDRSIFKNLKP